MKSEFKTVDELLAQDNFSSKLNVSAAFVFLPVVTNCRTLTGIDTSRAEGVQAGGQCAVILTTQSSNQHDVW